MKLALLALSLALCLAGCVTYQPTPELNAAINDRLTRDYGRWR